MERGFFHESMGYWQTLGKPDANIVNGYPDGPCEASTPIL